ncbi:MAG: hypothetical protein JSV45_09735 [Chromatiales bacterium]|nr:MAG: hypothetical protein JSV45_09735 [Chromatiales bacterium]
MNGSSRLLLIAGLLLILAGFLFGLGFSLAVDHQARLVAFDDYGPVFVSLGEAGVIPDEVHAASDQRSLAHRRAMDVHTHSVNLGILLLLIGLLSPLLAGGQTWQRRGLLALAGAAWLYPAGLLLQFFGSTRAGEIVAAIGAAVIIVAFAVVFLRISRALGALATASTASR